MWQQSPQQYTWMEGLKSKHYINMTHTLRVSFTI